MNSQTKIHPIKEARLERGMSQSDLAAAVGVSLPTIAQWERGIMHPSPENQERLEAALGIKIPPKE